jgi:hypothetical protein
MEKDLSVFDKSVMELFELSKDILKAKEKRSLRGVERGNPFFSHLEKYMRTYAKTEPEEHIGYFEKIYNDHKRSILLGPQRDSWLADGKIVVSYGEDCGLKTEMKVHLSAIYFTACKIRDEIKEEVEGLPETSENIEIEYPSRYLLLLYNIFSEISNSDNEKTKLISHIESLENINGIRSASRSSKSGDDLISGLFDMAEQVSGTKIPRDKMPGKNAITKMFGDMMSDPKTKSMLGNVMQTFQNADGVGDIAAKLVGALGSTATPTAASTETVPTASQGDVNDEFAD